MKYLLLVLITISFLWSGCAESFHISDCLYEDRFGFWGGLWHGFILPFSFIASLFVDSVAIYAVDNTGGWYDFGFILGMGSFTYSAQ